MKAERATSHVMLIGSVKSRSAKGASHQPVFMGSCLAFSHTCLPCLPSGRVSPTCVLCPLMIGLMRNDGSVELFFARSLYLFIMNIYTG